MAQPRELAKIAEEAWAMCEESVAKKKVRQPLIPQAPPQKPMDCYEAAKAFGGMLMVDFHGKKFMPPPPPPPPPLPLPPPPPPPSLPPPPPPPPPPRFPKLPLAKFD
ncbi:hypothetical protein NL676_022383 [Syzygium grande]|nr:hypothetical protein NL676_022383 [Syzygium grande]